MERYVLFAPVPALRGKFSHGHLCEDGEGIRVTLFVEDSAATVKVHYRRAAAYRRRMEECNLGGFDGHWEDDAAAFVVSNSRWTASFSEAELVHHASPVHYLFLTGWQEIEVLSSEAPTVTANEV